MIKPKKAISDIVSTVLIIMVAVAAVGIIGVIVVPMVRNSLTFSDVEVELTITEAVYDEAQNAVFLVVSRGSDDYNLSGISVIISGENSIEFQIEGALIDINSARTYKFKGVSFPARIASVNPAVTINGKEKKLGISSEVELIARTWSGPAYELHSSELQPNDPTPHVGSV